MNGAKRFLTLLNERLSGIHAYMDENGYTSYDPYDGLKSPLSSLLSRRFLLCSRLWLHGVRLFPMNIRKYLCISPMVHTKALSDFASGYSILYSVYPDEIYKDKADQAFQVLKQAALLKEPGLGWGLNFPFITRFVRADESTPNIFQTINAVHAFLDGYAAFRNERYLLFAQKGFLFLENYLGYVEENGCISWNYWKGLPVRIFNVSGLMIGLCARMAAYTEKEKYHSYACKLHKFIRRAQNGDGSWFYAADRRGQWVDGYHTGYILEGLCRAELEGADLDGGCLRRGSEYYLTNLFTTGGFPRYYSNSHKYPLDVQNSAQALQTLVFLSQVNISPVTRVADLFANIDSELWNPKGYYNCVKRRFWSDRTPMHRWGTGPMFLALAHSVRLLEMQDTKPVSEAIRAYPSGPAYVRARKPLMI